MGSALDRSAKEDGPRRVSSFATTAGRRCSWHFEIHVRFKKQDLTFATEYAICQRNPLSVSASFDNALYGMPSKRLFLMF